MIMNENFEVIISICILQLGWVVCMYGNVTLANIQLILFGFYYAYTVFVYKLGLYKD